MTHVINPALAASARSVRSILSTTRPARLCYCRFGLWGALSTLACGDTGPAGQEGSAGVATSSTLLAIAAEQAGSHCEGGGQRIEAGLDLDANGKLDAAEVTSTAYVCDGATGAQGASGAQGATGAVGRDGATTRISLAAEQPGEHCARGGHRVDTGLDADLDGELDGSEVSNTAYVCDGAPGATGPAGHASLFNVSDEAAGDHCTFGGKRLDDGVDVNDDGALAEAEVTRTSYLCNADGATGAGSSFCPAAPGMAASLMPGGVCLADVATGATWGQAAKLCTDMGADLCSDSQVWVLRAAGVLSEQTGSATWTNAYADNDGLGWAEAVGGMTDDHAATTLAYAPCCYKATPARSSDVQASGVRVVAVYNVADAPFGYAASFCSALNADLCNAGQYYALRQAGAVTVPVWSNSHSDNDLGYLVPAYGAVLDNPTPASAYGFACCATRSSLSACPAGTYGGVCAVSVNLSRRRVYFQYTFVLGRVHEPMAFFGHWSHHRRGG